MSLQSEEFVLYKIDEEQNIEIYGQPQINIESLYLTNLSLVYVVVTSNRAFRKKETQEVRICVKDIKILNGLPQIFIEEIRDENEELGWKLQIFLKTGGISFLINEYSTVKEMQKEKIKFMNELYKVLVGHPYSVDLMNEERVISSTQAGVRKGSEIGKNIADAVKVVPIVGGFASKVIGIGTGFVGGAIGGIAGAVNGLNNKNRSSKIAIESNVTYTNSVANNSQQLQQIKCKGCHCLLSGYTGERIVCSYCDTEQII